MSSVLSAIVVSACLGALIGLIRQWTELADGAVRSDDFGGVRTYTLWSISGCVATVLGQDHGTWVLPVVVAAVAVHQIFGGPARHAPGSTSFAACLITLLVGALVAWEQTQAAALVAAATMVIVGVKKPIHDSMRRFTSEDLRGTLQFVAITGVILPLVPDRAFGPYDLFNPYSTWMMVVLISGLGFSGYIAMRLLGSRAGILMTSLLGGVASSTASTLAFSRRSKEDPALSTHYAFAVVVACTVMLPRVIVAVAVIDRRLAWTLAPLLGIMTLPALGYGIWWVVSGAKRSAEVATPALSNPLSLATAIKFALLYAAIVALVKTATQFQWQAGLLPLSFVSGLTDMDAISLSMARNHRDQTVALSIAAQGVLLGAIANTLLKIGLATSLGSSVLRRQVAVVLGLTAIAGVAAWIWFRAGA